MGLNIAAYKNLKVVKNAQLDSEGNVINWDKQWKPGESMEWSEKYFPGRAEGIEAEKVYEWEEEYDFSAGSHSGYNCWRADLAKFTKGDDFIELIDFSDCEGVIGPIVSKKLAQDFNNNLERAKTYSLTVGEHWLNSYFEWKTAFEMAAENGAVSFH